MSKVTWNTDGANELGTSRDMRRVLDAAAFTITAHAIPHVGVDTGRLVNSLDHDITNGKSSLVAFLGSNAGQAGVDAVEYASWHLANRPDAARATTGRREIRRKSIPHPTKKAPTRPYAKALNELGITFTIEPGGFES